MENDAEGMPSPSYFILSEKSQVTLRLLPNHEQSQVFMAPLAINSVQQRTGLSGQNQPLPPSQGLLFLFPFFGRPAFTLAQTKISLDVVFLKTVQVLYNEKVIYTILQIKTVGAFDQNLQIGASCYDAVLEINAGAAQDALWTEGSSLLAE